MLCLRTNRIQTVAEATQGIVSCVLRLQEDSGDLCSFKGEGINSFISETFPSKESSSISIQFLWFEFSFEVFLMFSLLFAR